MKNLIKCDFFKMRKEKAHIILLIVLVGLIIVSYLLVLALENLMGSEFSPEIVQTALMDSEFDMVFANLAFVTHTGLMGAGTLGVIIVLSITINLGNDYKNRTINLKILSGHSRLKIFISTLTVNYLTFLAYFILCGAVSVACGYIFFGGFGVPISGIIKNALLMLPHYLAIVAITVFISTCLKSTLGIVINLLIIVVINQVLWMIGVYLAQKSDIVRYISEMVPYIALNNLALGQVDFELAYVLRNIFGAIAFMIAGLAGGFLVFRKKELV